MVQRVLGGDASPVLSAEGMLKHTECRMEEAVAALVGFEKTDELGDAPQAEATIASADDAVTLPRAPVFKPWRSDVVPRLVDPIIEIVFEEEDVGLEDAEEFKRSVMPIKVRMEEPSAVGGDGL